MKTDLGLFLTGYYFPRIQAIVSYCIQAIYEKLQATKTGLFPLCIFPIISNCHKFKICFTQFPKHIINTPTGYYLGVPSNCISFYSCNLFGGSL